MTSSYWSSIAVENLIEEYKKHKCLYSTGHPQYHNKYVRQEALKNIAKNLQLIRYGTSEEDIKEKMRRLRTVYMNERKKIKARKELDNEFKPNLWYFDKLEFLNEHVAHKSSATVFGDNGNQNNKDSYIIIENNEDKDNCTMKSELVSNCEELSADQDFYTHQNIVIPTADISKSEDAKRKRNESSDDFFAEFIASRLSRISNKRIKTKCEHAILKALCDAEAEEISLDTR